LNSGKYINILKVMNRLDELIKQKQELVYAVDRDGFATSTLRCCSSFALWANSRSALKTRA
jgi:hypothetical protein